MAQAIKYVLDAGFFVVARSHYPKVYPTFWDKLNQIVESGAVISVKEVEREIKNYGGEQEHLLEWIKTNQAIFLPPTEEEQKIVRYLLEHYPNMVEKKKYKQNKAYADPFVIAKAKIENATLVTTEKKAKKNEEAKTENATPVTTEQEAKKNNKGEIKDAFKIPDICKEKELKIKCINLREFMEEQQWVF